MSVAFSKFNAFVADVANKVHNLGSDQMQLALCAAANAPIATNAVLADLTEISYTNLSSRAVTTTSSSQSSGLYKLILGELAGHRAWRHVRVLRHRPLQRHRCQP